MAPEQAPASASKDDWQALPSRARGVFMLHGLWLVPPAAVAAWVLAQVGGLAVPWAWCLAAVLATAATGAWLGHKRWQHTRWRLDADGFSLRRGRVWRTETRVPQSRVQHLDLRHGPLQRRFALATLVIHTAGTRHSAVEVAGLDAADAERLRERLARQRDDDDHDADA